MSTHTRTPLAAAICPPFAVSCSRTEEPTVAVPTAAESAATEGVEALKAAGDLTTEAADMRP